MTTQNHFREIQEKYAELGVGDFRDMDDGLLQEVTPEQEL